MLYTTHLPLRQAAAAAAARAPAPLGQARQRHLPCSNDQRSALLHPDDFECKVDMYIMLSIVSSHTPETNIDGSYFFFLNFIIIIITPREETKGSYLIIHFM